MSNSAGDDSSASGQEPTDQPAEPTEPTEPLGYWEQQARAGRGGQLGYGPPQGPPLYGPVGGYPPPGHLPSRPKHDGATTALMLGIIGLVVCQLASPFAWWYGKKTMNEIEASGGRLDGYGEAKAGWICGIIGSVVLGTGLVLILLFVVLAIGVVVSAGA